MFYSVDGRIVQVDGKFPIFQDNTLVFKVFGPSFPWSENFNTNRQFIIRSSEPNEVEINFADGVVQNYSFNPSGDGFVFAASGILHTYQDGNTGNRIITLKFKKSSKITSIQTLRVNLGANFPSNIVRFSGLEEISLRISTGVENFPVELQKLQNLKIVDFSDVELDNLPLPILNTSIETLRIVNNIDLSQPFSVTNFDKLNLLQNTLLDLGLERLQITSFPQNFEELNIKSLTIGGNLFNEIPNFFPVSLEIIVFASRTSTLRNYNNFDRLINLDTIYFREIRDSYGLNDALLTIPASFSNLTKLKTFILQGEIIDTVENIDTFINSVYGFISINASKTTGNTPFRNITINGASSSLGSVPTGIYQEPAGFQLGISDGSPQTPQERIWLAVNQYGATWNYNQT